MLSKEEFEAIVRETRVSSLTANHGDPLRDLAEEIYWEGYCDGYNRAAYLLQQLRPRIAGSNAEAFFNKNMGKIHRRVKAMETLDQG